MEKRMSRVLTMMDEVDRVGVETEVTNFDESTTEFYAIQNEVFALQNEEEKEEEDNWFAEKEMKIFNFKTAVYSWMEKFKPAKHRSASAASSSKSSRSKSSKSSRKSTSSINEEKIKVAVLSAEIEFNKTKQKPVEDLELELVKATAKLNVLQELDEDRKCKEVESDVKKINDPNKFNESICQLLKQQSVPDIKLESFDGNPLNFHHFIAMFGEVVEKKVDDERTRLTRLIQFTKGEAKESIRHFIHHPPDKCYTNALNLLKRRYGNPHLVLSVYRKEIKAYPQLNFHDPRSFRDFLNFLTKCQSVSLENHWNVLDTPDTLCMLVSKLPVQLIDRWNRRVLWKREKEYSDSNLNDFIRFVEQESSLVNDPMFSRSALKEFMKPSEKPSVNDKTSKRDFKSCATAGKDKKCPLCSKLHDLDVCETFLSYPVSERSSFVRRKRLCFGCYEPTSDEHFSKTCNRRRKCKTCNGNHPSALHGFQIRPKPEISQHHKNKDSNIETTPTEKSKEDNSTLKSSAINHSNFNEIISMCIVPVIVYHPSSNRKIKTLAMLDNCSQACFMTDELLQQLDVNAAETTLNLRTINGNENVKSKVVSGLKVGNKLCGNANMITLPKVYTREELPVDEDEVATIARIKRWNYLDRIKHQFDEIDINVGLLIGANCTKALEPLEVINSQNDGPYAYRTVLGWCIVGPIDGSTSNASRKSNRIAVRDVSSKKIVPHHFIIPDETKETDVKQMLENMYNADFAESHSSHYAIDKQKSHIIGSDLEDVSVDDREFLVMMKNGITRDEGHYKLPLPFKNGDVKMPNNRKMAESRFYSLKRKLMKSKEFLQMYKTFMKDLLDNKYAERVSTKAEEGKIWYLPHHGVINPNKPGKVRVVFDCGAEINGKSLNKELIPGPDLTNQLFGVLCRFRQDRVAVMADIASMYYQVKVDEPHRSFLRFLWWEDDDYTKPPVDYQMNVHVFGAGSSASCSNYALKTTATDNEKEFDYEVADVLWKNFYVDDMLKSKEFVKDMIATIQKVRKMCRNGGFHLTKFTSNNNEVLQSLPKDVVKDKPTAENDLFKDDAANERALGISWNTVSDTFEFKLTLKERPYTRRGMLSTLSSLYDPLGLVSPYIIEGKLILQRLCAEGLQWDELVDDVIKNKWTDWTHRLNEVEKLKIDRCYKPMKFGKIVNCSLHMFSDASELAYGQCSYLRLINEKGDVHCTLIAGKARVAPIKYVSIPRLELTAAVLSVKMANLIEKEIQFPINKKYFWTDSKVVLSYIASETKRYKVFVANRVQTIRENSDVNDWYYVSSKNNPSDIPTRLNKKDRENAADVWLNGPKFLRNDESTWDEKYPLTVLEDSDPEIKKTTTLKVNTITSDEHFLTRLIDRISSWMKLIRVVGWMIRLKNVLFNRRLKKKSTYPDDLSVEEIVNSTSWIVKQVQRQWLKDEYENLCSGMCVTSHSKIQPLDPIIDDDGIIRVGGRLRRSEMSSEVIHPMIIPKESKIAEKIIQYCHAKVAHGGRGYTINEIRDRGFWIVNVNSMTRKAIYYCVRCRYLRGRLGSQKMASLPAERLKESPPFTYCGVDLFGSFMIKNGRKEIKRYGALFTCFASRAVHIEVVSSLETDTFILALRRFIGRRGNIRYLRSDNGSNFIGANKELRNSFKQMDHDKISKFLHESGGDWVWKMNPPSASHFGGVWERQIRSARITLTSLMNTHGKSLDDESLQTLMIETEAILNSRPLTVETLSDSSSLKPISPSNILTMKSKVILPPPGEFSSVGVYSKRRWRRVQHIANEFWTRWRKEFLTTLQTRNKWQRNQRNFNVGDVVVLKDDNIFTQRNTWPLAKIIETFPDDKGVVRTVKLLYGTPKVELIRPISKIVLLVENESK